MVSLNMNKLEISINDGVAELIGSLNSTAVSALKNKIQRKITKHREITLNLSKITDIDTAGLAWLLFILEQANKSGCQLSFAHLPEDLLKLAKLSAVDEFLSSPTL